LLFHVESVAAALCRQAATSAVRPIDAVAVARARLNEWCKNQANSDEGDKPMKARLRKAEMVREIYQLLT